MSRMYRIMIVEDEEIERKALTMMLKYNRQDIQEIRTAENGVQALEIYREYTPDIVFMDINLPGINGLDVIRQIRFLNDSSNFVIISAHSQFSYAQEAIRLGVQDFLVKPIKLEDINRFLDDIIQVIEEKQSRKAMVQRQREKMDAIRPVLERDCVLSIASMRSGTPLATIFDFMQIKVVSGIVFTLRGDGIGGAALRDTKAQIKNMGLYCIGEMIGEVCVCVALSDRTISTSQVQEMMHLLTNRLQRNHPSCCVGVGSVADCADDLRRSFEQAMASSRQESGISRKDGEETSLDHLTAESQKIVQCIRTGNAEDISKQVQLFFSAFQRDASYHQIQEASYWLYIMVVGNVSGHKSGIQILTSDQIFATKDILALRNTLIEAFVGLVNLQNDESGQQSNQIVVKAMQIVQERFREDLTLDLVAEELNISLFYLSKLFRKHTGTSFTEYLTQVRMNRAKELLEAGSLSVKEVAYAAGFNSQSYFSKLFKKYTGQAPSEYKGE